MAALSEGLIARVRAATGKSPRNARPLSGGCIAEVLKLELEGGGACVAKLGQAAASGPGLALEAFMLDYLARETALPVPAVLHASDELLLLDYVESGGSLDADAQAHAAELLAALHGIGAPQFGFERDTLIGPLPQPNPWSERWIDFFAESRLLHFGRLAVERGRLPGSSLTDLERLCTKLDRYIEPGTPPSLIHGDVWGGNVLVKDGRIAAFIDPALYFADPEIELAFSTLFGTFGDAFFRRYGALRPLKPGFFEIRRDLYTLYPLLVHAFLFGAPYDRSVQALLDRYA